MDRSRKAVFPRRFADWKTPEYRHLLLLLYWPLEITFFVVCGRLPWTYHPVSCALDAQIPFCAVFVLPYLSWFLCILAVSVGLLRHDVPVFRRFMGYLIVTISLAGLVFLIYPTSFPGRPDPVPGSGALAWVVRLVYRLDPPHNVAPSEHVIVAAGMTVAVLQADRLRRPAFSVPFTLLQLLIVLSVVFVKQHSALDILGALPVILLGCLCCFVPWRSLRRKKSAETGDA